MTSNETNCVDKINYVNATCNIHSNGPILNRHFVVKKRGPFYWVRCCVTVTQNQSFCVNILVKRTTTVGTGKSLASVEVIVTS